MAYTVEQLCDREAIRDVALRYCRGVDRLDVECMKSAYWPEAVDEHGSFVGSGHLFAEYCMGAHSKWSWTMHSILNHLIEFDAPDAPDVRAVSARGEIYNITVMCRVDGGDLDTWYGRYLDRYERRGEQWRILRRVCVHHGTFSAPASPMPINAERYLGGTFDRPAAGRGVGPPETR